MSQMGLKTNIMERKRERSEDSIDEKMNEDNISSTVDGVDSQASPSKVRKVGLPHVRDIIEPLPLTNGTFCKIITWNVAGLRGILKNNANILDNLVRDHQPDIICLQETKLQPIHTSEFEDMLPQYRSYWTCSEEKKGYSGNVMFIRKSIQRIVHVDSANPASPAPKKSKQMTLSSWAKPKKEAVEDAPMLPPVASPAIELEISKHISIDSVAYELDDARFKGEGRTITVDLGLFYVVACYVPNSGDNLKRLDYRINEWDPYMRDYLSRLRAVKPVIFTGDLNVGHLDLDIHNPHAKHIAKQSGLTPEERNSFSTLLSTGFTDALRFLYPDARGAFTYWSMRTNARPINHGIRLDYFICSNDLFGEVVNDTSSSATTDHQIKSINEIEAVEEVSETTTNSSGTVTKSKRVKKVKVVEVEVELEPRRLSPVLQKNLPIPSIYDSYILHSDTIGISDHCPAVLVVRLE